MHYIPILVELGTEDNTAFTDNSLCQGSEDATRGTFSAYLLIPVLGGIYLQWFAWFVLVDDGTHLLAKTAIGAGACVHHRIQETLVVLLHGYAYEQTNADSMESTYEQGLNHNPCLEHSVAMTKYVGAFWKEYQQYGISATDHIADMIRPSLLCNCHRLVVKVMRMIVHILFNRRIN